MMEENRRQASDCVKAYGCVSVCQPARTLFFRSVGRPATGSLRDPAALRKCPLRGRKSSLREQKNLPTSSLFCLFMTRPNLLFFSLFVQL